MFFENCLNYPKLIYHHVSEFWSETGIFPVLISSPNELTFKLHVSNEAKFTLRSWRKLLPVTAPCLGRAVLKHAKNTHFFLNRDLVHFVRLKLQNDSLKLQNDFKKPSVHRAHSHHCLFFLSYFLIAQLLPLPQESPNPRSMSEPFHDSGHTSWMEISL